MSVILSLEKQADESSAISVYAFESTTGTEDIEVLLPYSPAKMELIATAPGALIVFRETNWSVGQPLRFYVSEATGSQGQNTTTRYFEAVTESPVELTVVDGYRFTIPAATVTGVLAGSIIFHR